MCVCVCACVRGWIHIHLAVVPHEDHARNALWVAEEAAQHELVVAFGMPACVDDAVEEIPHGKRVRAQLAGIAHLRAPVRHLCYCRL